MEKKAQRNVLHEKTKETYPGVFLIDMFTGMKTMIEKSEPVTVQEEQIKEVYTGPTLFDLSQM